MVSKLWRPRIQKRFLIHNEKLVQMPVFMAFAHFIFKEVIYMKNEIKVVMVEPHKNPTITTIKTKLENLQEAVGGLIEIIDIEDNVSILCNEEGKLIGLEGNRKIGDDILVGTFFVCGSNDEGELISLTDLQIEKYIQFFWEPQTFTQGEIESSIVFKFIPIEDWEDLI